MNTTSTHKTTLTDGWTGAFTAGWTCTCGAGKPAGYKNRRTALLAARKHVATATNKEN